MKLPSRRKHGGIKHRIAGIKKWPSKAKHRIFKHGIARIKKIRHRTLKGEHPDNAIPLADTDIVVAPTSSTSAPTDMNSLPPEMLLAIFENLDSVQQQAIMRSCRSWMELLRQRCSTTIKLDMHLHRGKKLPVDYTSIIDFLLQDRIRHPVINTSGEPQDPSLSYVDTIHLEGSDIPIKHFLRTEFTFVRMTLHPNDIEECGCYGAVVFRKPIILILENMEMDWAWLDESPRMFAHCRQIILKNFWLVGLMLNPKFPSSENNVDLSMEGFDRRIDFLQIECNTEVANVVSKQMLKKLSEVEEETWGANESRMYNCCLRDLSYYMKPSGPSHQSGQVLEKELQRLGLVETTLDWNGNFGSQSLFVRHLLRVSFEAFPHDDHNIIEHDEDYESSDDSEEEEAAESTDDDHM